MELSKGHESKACEFFVTPPNEVGVLFLTNEAEHGTLLSNSQVQ